MSPCIACLEAQELYRLKKAAREARTKPGSKRYFKIKVYMVVFATVCDEVIEDDLHKCTRAK